MPDEMQLRHAGIQVLKIGSVPWRSMLEIQMVGVSRHRFFFFGLVQMVVG